MNASPDKALQTLLCAWALFVWYAITLMVTWLPHFPKLASNGMLMPVICTLEFIALVPFYRWYNRRFGDIPLGPLIPRQAGLFSLLLLLLIASQSLYMQPENWIIDRFSAGDNVTPILFFLSVVVLAPIYEEILFRGFLLQGCLLWAPRERVICSLLTSVVFAAVHTQYVHLQTFIALLLLSLLLCAARIVSGGLKLPVFLHMLNNLIAAAPMLWYVLTR